MRRFFFIAFLSLCAVRGVWGGSLEGALSLLSAPGKTEEALHKIGSAESEAARQVLLALREGSLYRYQGVFYRLLEDGSLRDLSGKVLMRGGEPYLPKQGLQPVPVDAKYFGVIDREVQKLSLFSPKPSERRGAAFRLLQTKDIVWLPLLKKALEREQSPKLKRAIAESYYQLSLLSGETTVQRRAIERLKRLHSEASLSALKALAQENAELRPKAEEAIASIQKFARERAWLGFLFNGLSLSSILLMMSLGLAITFGLMGIINMAHGEMLMLGSYTAYVVQNIFAHSFPAHKELFFFAALPISFLVVGLVGLALEWGIIRHLYGRPLETLIATWGVGMVLQQGVRLVFGDQASVDAPTYFRGGWEVLPGLIFPWSRLFILALALLSLFFLYFIFYKSFWGLKVRAAMQNRGMASCLGIATRKIDAATFALGTAIAGVAGCALSLTGTVDPEVGKTYIVDSFMVVVFGGVGKLWGTVVAALGLGTVNKLLEPFISGTAGAIYAKVAVLGLVIFFLQWKPTGLFPAKGRTESLT